MKLVWTITAALLAWICVSGAFANKAAKKKTVEFNQFGAIVTQGERLVIQDAFKRVGDSSRMTFKFKTQDGSAVAKLGDYKKTSGKITFNDRQLWADLDIMIPVRETDSWVGGEFYLTLLPTEGKGSYLYARTMNLHVKRPPCEGQTTIIQFESAEVVSEEFDTNSLSATLRIVRGTGLAQDIVAVAASRDGTAVAGIHYVPMYDLVAIPGDHESHVEWTTEVKSGIGRYYYVDLLHLGGCAEVGPISTVKINIGPQN